MKRSRIASLSVLAITAFAACSSSSDDLPTGSAGAAPGSSGSGATPSAGAPGNSAGASTSGQGGSGSSAAGMTSTAGAPVAGNSTGGGGASSAGGAGAGAGGTMGGAGSANGGMGSGGGGNHTVKASAGCMKGSTQVTIPNSLVAVPPGYDGKTPVPVVIAFHAAGNNNTSMQNNFKDSDLSKKYLMIYPNSTSASGGGGDGWNLNADKNRYLEVQAAVLSQACVDENRVYATGHSSGAQFVVALLCSGDADFDAVAPVASSVYCQKWKKGPIPALAIHGVQDEERTKYGLNDGDGKKDLQPYLASNMCMMTSTPFTPDVSACKITNGVDGKPFNPGCVEFSGCSAKTRWCNHNDPQYGTTNHGIPCFGKRAIYDFFESL